ncbi:MAG: PCMD domain-containing protein [Paludibacteraceae bacterium]|nr:PCMD domain-containing protein [Paludibacteraceae bacterium]
MKSKIFIIIAFVALSVNAQERVELLPFGDFEHWSEQQLKESALIGGQTKTLYKIGGPWSSSNAHARAFGVDKISVSVTPEKRGDGYCCKMQSTLENVSAVGIDFKALATGSIYTGTLLDVVGLKQSSDPNSAIDMGVPFADRPTALVLDYKALIQDAAAVYAPAKTKVKEVSGHDKGQITLILQHRWEENGHVYAYRVGTATEYISQSTTDWVNGHRVEVCYGAPKADCQQPWHELSNTRHKTHNSQGKMVCIEEVDFRDDVEPTHLIIQISAGSMPPFTGCPGNTVWCDNIALVYEQPAIAQSR